MIADDMRLLTYLKRKGFQLFCEQSLLKSLTAIGKFLEVIVISFKIIGLMLKEHVFLNLALI